MNIFVIIYFIADIMRIANAKFQPKIFNIVGSRAFEDDSDNSIN